MNLEQRISNLSYIFEKLQSTNSRLEKQAIVDLDVPPELKDDFMFCIEVLAGKHKLGYTYYKPWYREFKISGSSLMTVKQLYEFLQTPLKDQDLSEANIDLFVSQTWEFADFLEPLCNRTLKLGIGNSLLEKTSTSPMLAKKYEGQILADCCGFYITEKLDGNRCIAFYKDDKWNFQSRNGKPLNVDFDMSGLPTAFIYDGEILSPSQVEMSEYIFEHVCNNDVKERQKWASNFNNTSGLINRHGTNKRLIYNIFDIVDEETVYTVRRNLLNRLEPKSNDVRILSVLAYKSNLLQADEMYEMLGKVADIGGEGLMINLGNRFYDHKRTNSLLKFKQVQSMDMVVVGTNAGTGKYEGLVGAINCKLITDDGKIFDVNVGSGLSDVQRVAWLDETKIVGKIVEIEYFDISQNKYVLGSKRYSLRFPRLKRVREDKEVQSQW